jgi:hypothetical protein
MKRRGDLRSPPRCHLNYETPALIRLSVTPMFFRREKRRRLGISQATPAKREERVHHDTQPGEDEHLSLCPRALKFIETSDKITAFEGLPHQLFEAPLLKKELIKVDETLIGEFAFYPHAQDLRKEDEVPLRDLISVPKHISPFLYFKMCGGFHPDYAIRFSKGDQHCDILLCIGCGDGMILHDGNVIHCHIHGGWKEIPAHYAKHRPRSEG